MNLNNSDQMFNVMNHEITFFNSKFSVISENAICIFDNNCNELSLKSFVMFNFYTTTVFLFRNYLQK